MGQRLLLTRQQICRLFARGLLRRTRDTSHRLCCPPFAACATLVVQCPVCVMCWIHCLCEHGELQVPGMEMEEAEERKQFDLRELDPTARNVLDGG